MSSNNMNSSLTNTIISIPTLRRQTTSGKCYYCGECPENKEVEYRCWNCNNFATPLAAHASWEAFQRKGAGWPNSPNDWWLNNPKTKTSWYVWTRRWNNLPESNLHPYWAQKLRLKKMEDLINIW